jgi:hypothetical protein
MRAQMCVGFGGATFASLPHLDCLVILASDELMRHGVQCKECRSLRVEYFLQLVGGDSEHLVRCGAGIDRGDEIYKQGVLGGGSGEILGGSD